MQGDFPLTILIHPSTGWVRLPLPDEVAALMNYGQAKDAIFSAVRAMVQKSAADGVIFATDAWRAETTPEGFKYYDTPEWRKLHDTGFVKLLQRGWVKRTEAFIVTAQSATDVLIINQNYQRLESGMIQLLDCKRAWADQSAFNGRQKMFGDLRRENLGQRRPDYLNQPQAVQVILNATRLQLICDKSSEPDDMSRDPIETRRHTIRPGLSEGNRLNDVSKIDAAPIIIRVAVTHNRIRRE